MLLRFVAMASLRRSDFGRRLNRGGGFCNQIGKRALAGEAMQSRNADGHPNVAAEIEPLRLPHLQRNRDRLAGRNCVRKLV